MMNMVDRLTAALEIISDPKKWTKGSRFSREGKGFCAIDAYLETMGLDGADAAHWMEIRKTPLPRAAREIAKRQGEVWSSLEDEEAVWRVNDWLGQSAAIAMYELAIQYAKEEELENE